MNNTIGNSMEMLQIYFNPVWVAYFVSILSLCVAAYSVYLVMVLGDYVETLKKQIRESNSYSSPTNYSSKTKRK